MKKVGSVKGLYLSIKGNSNRKIQEHLYLDCDGVKEDKFYAKDKERAILVTSLASYTLALEHGITIEQGILGENIIIDYNLYHLLPGDRITIAGLELEVTQNCTLCNGLSKVDAKLPKLLKEGRGIFMKAITSGSVKKGDSVYLFD